MFGVKHCIILVCVIVLIVGLLFLIRKWTLEKKCKVFLAVGICSEVVKIFTYIIINEDKYGGILPKSDLPFHLCSIQIIFILIVVFAKSEKMKRVLLSFIMPSGLIGGAAALLIPTNSSLTVWPITFQYNIYHCALVAFAISLLTDKQVRFELRDYYSSLVFVFALLFFAVYINSIIYDAGGVTGANFMYVASPPVSGLPYLNENHGWFVYIMHYAILVFISITACYAKPIYKGIKAYRGVKK